MKRFLWVELQTWHLRKSFKSAYGVTCAVDIVLVTIGENGVVGRGEARAFGPYGTTCESIVADVLSVADEVKAGVSRETLQQRLPAGAARNAIDCALWDLEAKRTGVPVWRAAGLPEPAAITPILIVSAIQPSDAAMVAGDFPKHHWFKVKLSGEQDLERVAAVHSNAPTARIIVDPNCSWSPNDYKGLAPALAYLGVVMIEQPFAAGQDHLLRDLPRPIPVCADESCVDLESIDRLVMLYDSVSIKLDKAGGLTEACRMIERTRAAKREVMVSCMISTSLGMAPTVLLAGAADYADLGGPIELAQDYSPAMTFENGRIPPIPRELWG